jgi:hypothetical protein
MTLKSAITADAGRVFLDTAAFAESVTYHPRLFKSGDVRTSRTISAVVIRESLSSVAEDGGESITPIFEVHVANNATTGISSTELDTGGDQIALPIRDGMAATKRAIVRLITQDEGMLVLECR